MRAWQAKTSSWGRWRCIEGGQWIKVFTYPADFLESILRGNYECNMDQELSEVAAYASGRRCWCMHQVAALFCEKWHHGHWPRFWKYDIISELCQSMHLLEEQSCQISSWSNLKRRSLQAFEEDAPTSSRKKERQHMSIDTRSVLIQK